MQTNERTNERTRTNELLLVEILSEVLVVVEMVVVLVVVVLVVGVEVSGLILSVVVVVVVVAKGFLGVGKKVILTLFLLCTGVRLRIFVSSLLVSFAIAGRLPMRVASVFHVFLQLAKVCISSKDR